MVDSVVVFIVNILDIGAGKYKRNAPVPTHPDSPTALPITFQGVQLQSWQRHVSRFDRHVQPTKDEPKPTGVIRIYSGGRAVQEEAFQSLMSEFENRHRRNCNM
jgi:hypothetical protein